MIKIHFMDYRAIEFTHGLRRELCPPAKFAGNPILASDHPAEGNFMSLYGSVVRRPEDGLWQMWYTVMLPNGKLALAYAESGDGVAWQRPGLDIVQAGGQTTHILLDKSPHGATVIYDDRDERPEWRYKLMAGAEPSDRISAFRSADGLHWLRAAENPVIGTHPDCPMSLQRAHDGRYVLYCRPAFGDRRVGRRESWDFVHWSEPRTVLDQDPLDEPQTQFYGMGAIPYGPYELGTLWIYRTVEDDLGFHKMHGHQHTELAYTRTGYAWHRAALGTPWIARGEPGDWDWGMVQAASAPVLLEDEIRFYYAGCRTEHGQRDYHEAAPRWGIGYAALKPDRFVALVAEEEGDLLTRPFWTAAPEFHVNAHVRRGGALRVGVEDVGGQPIAGFGIEDCVPVEGDSLRHTVAWRGAPDRAQLANRELRLRVQMSQATLHALMAGAEAELGVYWHFDVPAFLTMERQRARLAP